MDDRFDSYSTGSGFARAGYDPLAKHPGETNWSRHSPFRAPEKGKTRELFRLMDYKIPHGMPGFAADRDGCLLFSGCKGMLENGEGYIWKIGQDGTTETVFTTKKALTGVISILQNGDYLVYEAPKTKEGYRLYEPINLYRIAPNGEIVWTYLISDKVPEGRPVIDSAGNIYLYLFSSWVDRPWIIISDGELLCLDADGKYKWSARFPSNCWGDPVISNSGRIYIGLIHRRSVAALDSDGNVLWEKGSYYTDFFSPGPTLDEEENLYFESEGALVSLSKEGEQRMMFCPQDDEIETTPVICEDGTILAETDKGNMLLLDKNGSLRSSFPVHSTYWWPPVLDAAGNILVLSRSRPFAEKDRDWIQLYRKNGEKIWEIECKDAVRNIVLAGDGRMYFITGKTLFRNKTHMILVRVFLAY